MRLIALRQLGIGEPGRLPVDTHRFASQQIADKTLAQLQVGQGIATGRVEQAGTKTQFTTGGDCRRDTQARGYFPGHEVDPSETAEQRHHSTAILGHSQYRWLDALLQQQAGQGADNDTGRAQGEDRCVL
ncbi:hypothetical protein D3C75_866610 [compost metagenome]